MVDDGHGEQKARRVRKQTVFFANGLGTRSKARQRRISMDVGERPADLKPSLKKPDYSATSTSKMAKKIKRKYSKKRKINFHNTCRVALITPLPGWNPYAIRMEDNEEDENEAVGNLPARQPKTRGHRILKNLTITPLSLQKIEATNIMDIDDEMDTRIEFNATFMFNGSDEDSKSKTANVKSRRKSAARLSPAELAAILPEIENAEEAGGDAKIEEVPVVKKDRKKSRRSLIFPPPPALKDPKDEPLSPVAEERMNKSRNRRRSTAILVALRSNTPEVVVKTGKTEALVGKKTSKEDEKTMTIKKKVKASRVSDWLMKAPVEARDSSLEREREHHTDAFDDCVVSSSLSESTLMKKVKERRMAIRQVVVEKSKSPEIEEVFCSKALKRKITPYGETQQPKKGLFEQERVQEDFAPIPLFHCLEAIGVPDCLDEYPEVPKVFPGSGDLARAWTDSFPANELSRAASFIQLVKVSENDKKLMKSFAREWIDIFTNFDRTAAWTTVFSPTSSRQWLGDSSIAAKARSFVKKWKARVSKERTLFVSPLDKKTRKFRKRSAEESDGSDYEDESVIQTNPLIICGPPGSGKTALISCLAAESDMDVLEIHPGDRRNASTLKQKFDGAVKNQAVQPKSGSIATFFGAAGSQQTKETRPRQNLVVIEHVDISFEDDRDFWPTIKALATEARVPMIWTCEKMPIAEIYREPGLDSFEQIHIDYSPPSLLAKYIQCCLLLTTQLTAPLSELEQYVKALGCDLRRIMADLQVQTTDGSDLKLILPSSSRSLHSPLICDQNSTYRSRQEYLSDKKSSYQHVLDLLELVEISCSAPEGLVQTASALDCRLPSSSLATDFLPYLLEMDRVERIKASQSRRYMHYFSEVRSEAQVDRNGQLLPIVRQFSFYD